MFLSFLISSCSQPDDSKEKDITKVTNSRNSQIPEGACTNLSGFCNPDNIQTIPWTLYNVAGYPGCTFNVEVTINECNIGAWTTTYIGDFILVSYNCPQYTIDLQNAMNIGGSTLGAFISDFEKKLYQDFEDSYYLTNQISCANGQQRVFQWYMSSCKQYCLKYVENQLIQVRAYTCGTGCCRRQTSMCTNPETGKIEKTTLYYQVTAPNCGTINIDPGRLKCDAISLCTMTCQ